MFPIVRVDRNKAETFEQLGTKPKLWFQNGDRRVLFKAEERGTGEDWAEKVACELCDLLGIPHVRYELAFEIVEEKPGVVCDSFAPSTPALAHGNQLMLARDPRYPKGDERKYKVREHTVPAVAEVVRSMKPPPSNWMTRVPEGVASALDVFAGYTMLDAWIANQDRHHQNWGAIRDDDGTLHLAPTFDHGASLARNLTDKERQGRLTTKDKLRQIGPFARRAISAFYADSGEKPLSTVAAWRAFAALVPPAAAAWLDRLRAIERATVAAILDQVPADRMSPVCREFTLGLAEENRKRLLNEDPE